MADASAIPSAVYQGAVTPDNHGPWLTVVAAILLTWMLLVLAIRLVIRLRFNGPWGNDDYVVTAGSLVAVAQSVSTIVSVGQGNGKKSYLLSPSQRDEVAKCIFAGQILYIVTSALSKISTSMLIARLTRVRRHNLATQAVSAITCIWAIVSIFVISFRCDLSAPWSVSHGGSCVSPFGRWIGIETVSMLLEIMLFGLAIFLVWGLQMSMRLKTLVVGAFLCRPLVLVTTAVRIYYLRPSFFQVDPFFNGILAGVLTQVCMHYALIAATVPTTKPFMMAFHSGWMDPEGYTGAGSNTRSKYARGSGYVLHSASENESRSVPAGTVSLRGAGGARSTSERSATGDSAASRYEEAQELEAFDFGLTHPQPGTLSRKPSARDQLRRQGDGMDSPIFRPDPSTTVLTRIEHDPRQRDSRPSGVEPAGDGMMIRQTREWEVSYEPAPR